MSRLRSRVLLVAGVSTLVLTSLVVADTAGATTEPAPEPAGSMYTSSTFVVPFEVTLPEWVAPEPAAELPNFVTWEGAEIDRGIRFLVPVNVFLNGDPTPSPVPDDYLDYLLGLSDLGASFDDVVETTVDGHPATVFTATTSTSLDGSIGCQEAELFAADCFGVQPDLILHMAVIDTDAGPLLVWQRDPVDAGPTDYESFEEMLASLHVREGVTPATEPAPPNTPAAVDSPIDGTWTTTVTRDELANSPLLYDTGEVNNQNWGDLTFTFDHGRFIESQHNPEAVWAMTGTYRIEDDVLYLDRDNGEQFAMRWHLDGDTLTLERDDALGEVPTPFIIKPWTRSDSAG